MHNLKLFVVICLCFFFAVPSAQLNKAAKNIQQSGLPDNGLLGVNPLTGNPSLTVTYNPSVVITAQFETMDVPKGVHPRLYYRAEDIPALKEKTAATGTMSSTFYKNLLTSANNTDLLTAAIRPLPEENDDNSHGALVESAANRALLYRLDPVANREKGLEAIAMAKNYLSTWRYGRNDNHYVRDGQASAVLHNFSLVYDWCYDLMTPAERRELIGEIKFKDPALGIHEGAHTDDPNNLSTGLMKALTMLEMSTGSAATNAYTGWERSFRIADFGAHNGHHVEICLPAVTAFAIAVYDEEPYPWQVISTWLFDNIFPTSNFLLEAGMPWQGASYGSVRLSHLARANLLVYQMMTPDSRKSCFTPDIVNAALSFLYYRHPDGQYVRMGDTFVTSLPFGVPHQMSETMLMLFINKIFRNPYLQKEMTFLLKHKNLSPLLGFLLWDDTLEPASYETLPTAYYSPYPNGEITHRTKWIDEMDFNSNAMHLNMKIGALRTWNHEHLDYGSFQIYYNGGLAVDAGIYEGSDVGQGVGFGSLPESGWDRSTNAHNTILIRDPKMDEKIAETSDPREQRFAFRGRELANGGGQYFTWEGQAPVRNLYRVNDVPYYFTNNSNTTTSPVRGKTIPGVGPVEGNIPTAKILSYHIPAGLKPSYTYLKGDMAEMYGYRASEAKRSFLSLDFNDDTYPGALVVFDRITSGNKWRDGANYEKYWLLHSMEKPDVIRDKDGLIDGFLIQRTDEVADGLKYNGQLHVTPLLPAKDNLNYELVEGHDVFGQPYRVGRGRMRTEEDGQFMFMTSPKRKRMTDLMLHVMQVADAGTKPLPVIKIGHETDDMVGAMIFDCIVMFSTNGNLIDERVTISPVHITMPDARKKQREDATHNDELKYHIADLAGGIWRVVDDKGQQVALFEVEAEGNIGLFTASATGVYTLTRIKATTTADILQIPEDALPELPRFQVDTQLKLDDKYLKTQLAKPVDKRDKRFKYVAPGSDLTAVLQEAQRGDILVLEANAVYSGTNGHQTQLPQKAGDDWIYIVSSAYPLLPDEHVRITPEYSAWMPKIVNQALPNHIVMGTKPGASHYRFIGIEITTLPTSKGHISIISIQPEGILPATYPANPEKLVSHIIFDRCYIHGSNPNDDNVRGIWMNGCKHIGVVDCWIDEIHHYSADAQAISGMNVLGVKIMNSYLEATGENVFFGGIGAVTAEWISGDIEVIGNHLFKPDKWNRFVPGHKVWRCKNLFELKGGQRILVDGNILENNWKDSDQWGYGVLFTTRTDRGACPWNQIKDITFTNNIIKNSSGGFQIAGLDEGKYGVPAKNILIRNNLILINDYTTNFSTVPYGDGQPSGDPADKKEPFQVRSQVENLIIDHNTVFTGGSSKVGILWGREGDEIYQGFRFINNVCTSPAPNKYGSKYGWVSDFGLEGTAAVKSYAKNGVIAGNVFAGIPDKSTLYHHGNYFLENDGEVMFNAYEKKDYRLALDSRCRDISLSTDGKIPGADLDLVYQKTAGVAFYGDDQPPPLRMPEPKQYFETPVAGIYDIGETIPLSLEMLKADVPSKTGESSQGHPLSNLLNTETGGKNGYIHIGELNITVDLGMVHQIGSAALCNGDNRNQFARFNVDISDDGVTWQRAARDFPAGKSSDDTAEKTGLTVKFGFGSNASGYREDTFILKDSKKTIDLFHSKNTNDSPTYIIFEKPQKARYIRFTVYGNTNKNPDFQRGSNISYIQVFGPGIKNYNNATTSPIRGVKTITHN